MAAQNPRTALLRIVSEARRHAQCLAAEGFAGWNLSPEAARTLKNLGKRTASPMAGESLEQVHKELAACHGCGLCRDRSTVVLGEGNPRADLVFVGEAPGKEEDEQGRPFVGTAGKLFDDILQKGMNLSREEVYVTNLVKCRPPENRDPTAEEINGCLPWLWREINAVSPRFICCLGLISSQAVLGSPKNLARLRGRVHEVSGYEVVCTYHPAYLHRTPSKKREAWEDIKLLLSRMGKKP
ncbi:MAG: uracil-DNA glycosylase [Deltaproteobacteria bacterium]|nr:uracil-DNA glycosylase [Deltaproteobacteria bacterium]